MLWEELREEEFLGALETSKGVCALPIGCVEAHGQHLPLGTDVIHVRHQTTLAAEKEPVVVFPSQYFGEKSGAGEFHGTIMFPERLIMDILQASCDEIGRNGFKKIVLVNGHGGNNSLLNTFARSVLQKDAGYSVFVLYPKLPTPPVLLQELEKHPYLTEEDIGVLKGYDPTQSYGHACFSETGIVYDARPDLVRLDLIDKVSGLPTHLFDGFSKRGIYTPFGWMGNCPNSYDGYAYPGMNERIARAMGENMIDQIAEVFRFLKEERISDDYYAQWKAKNFK